MSKDMMDIALTESFYNPIALLEFKADLQAEVDAKEKADRASGSHDTRTKSDAKNEHEMTRDYGKDAGRVAKHTGFTPQGVRTKSLSTDVNAGAPFGANSKSDKERQGR